MTTRWRTPRIHRAIATMLGFLLALGTTSPAAATTTAVAQPTTGGADVGAIEDLLGASIGGNPFGPDEEWIDPALTMGLDLNDLEPAPEFDPMLWHDSPIFATGVDLLLTEDERLEELADRHVRVLQVQATLDREVEAKANRIDARRPRVGVLLERIAHELENEARLLDEIAILNEAIAEYAVRAFISEDEINQVMDELNTEIPGARVVTNEVRADQVVQIDDREAEYARRQVRRAEHEDELRSVRSELRVLRRERLELLEQRRSMDALAERTEATYRVELHTRLPLFVDGTDLPLVAVNAYVIASRTMAEEAPQCGITWSMLAGIGRIESFHGHFAPSTLDINGQTTDDIRGPALDGRILEGAEFLINGASAPGATGKTEEQTIAPSTADTGAAPPEALASTEDVAAAVPAPSDGSPTPPTVAPLPVIKRLALIQDTDDGRLDGDTTYDRAVGPMQFIPQTWRRYNADGNLDGESDPQNIYDASLASARYLCTATTTMTTLEGEKQAYFAYNHDTEYTENVLEAGQRYAKAITFDEADDTELTHELGIANPEKESTVSKALESQRALSGIDALDW